MVPALSPSVRRIGVGLDVISVAGSAAAAYGMHALLRGHLAPLRQLPPPSNYVAVALLVLPVWIGLARVLRLHDIYDEAWPLPRLVWRLVVLHALGFLALSSMLFMTQSVINRSVVGLFLVSSFTSMLAVRLVLLRAAGSRHASGQSETRVLLIGDASDEMRRWVTELGSTPYPPKIVGRLGEPGEGDVLEHAGVPEDLVRVLEEQAVDHVVFFPPLHRPEEAATLLGACEDRGVPASFLVVLPQATAAAPRVFEYYDRPFVTFELAPRSPELLAIKHGFDFLVALLAIVLFAPVMAACALLILVSMGRPVMFVQSRAGRSGRSFR
ncbi:MAG: Undecaprenyl-phosphate galactosephosphotransferase, partial [Myxococcaceae bacterium]|nr:Undecaprenyl-phosphate galactosephosphotransferase [Myxococcaceae bacterium]